MEIFLLFCRYLSFFQGCPIYTNGFQWIKILAIGILLVIVTHGTNGMNGQFIGILLVKYISLLGLRKYSELPYVEGLILLVHWFYWYDWYQWNEWPVHWYSIGEVHLIIGT